MKSKYTIIENVLRSYAGVDRVGRYIRNQEQHRRKRDFQAEYLDFLERHEIEYDPRYVWD